MEKVNEESVKTMSTEQIKGSIIIVLTSFNLSPKKKWANVKLLEDELRKRGEL